MSQTFACEMTFIPMRYPHEITDRAVGEKLIVAINKDLRQGQTVTTEQPILRAKLDPFHNCWRPNTTWCIEIVPVTAFQVHWITNDEYAATFIKSLNWVFAMLKKKHKLVPMVIKRRNNKELHFPNGGNHAHWGADLFPEGSTWYQHMELFHTNLMVDYANNPWIRWLFAQWFDDENSRVFLTPEHLGRFWSPRAILDYSMEGMHAINARFMSGSKNSYLTFEFRFFNMVKNATELVENARFISAWVNSIAGRTFRKEKLAVTLTPDKFKAMSSLRFAPKIMKKFLDNLGLSWNNYEVNYQRNFVNRIKHGKLV